MTSIKEALEQASAMLVCLSRRYKISENHKIRFTGKWSHMGEISLGEVLDNANTALASLESGEARERIARAVTSEFEQMYKDGVPMCMREGETTWRTYYAGFDLSMFSNRIVDAILATGCVPGEIDSDDPLNDLVRRFAAALLEKLKAARVKYGYDEGWREPGWKADCQKNLIAHLAKGDPRDVAAYCAFMWHHGWSTVAPDESAIRADERERCAKVADEHSFGREIDWWLNATKKDVAAETCRSIAAAIRSGGVK